MTEISYQVRIVVRLESDEIPDYTPPTNDEIEDIITLALLEEFKLPNLTVKSERLDR